MIGLLSLQLYVSLILRLYVQTNNRLLSSVQIYSLLLLVHYVRIHLLDARTKLMRPPIQRHGFGEHVWEIDASAVQQLLYWCKYSAILLIFALAHSTRFYL